MRHALVRALVQHYAEQAGFAGKLRVYTRREPFDRLCRKRKSALDSSERAAYGVTLHGRIPAVWVNVQVHRTVGDLAETAAHEAIHVVSGPGVPCERSGRNDPKFRRRWRNLVRGLPPSELKPL